MLGPASLTVQRRQKVGVVGANGAGKSSLFALLLGELEPDRGEVELPAGIAVATVAQEAPAGDTALIDYVVCGDTRIAALRARLAEAAARGDAGAEAAAHAGLEAIHGYAAEAAASRVLRGLGFAPGDEARALDTLSGGWRMRAALARALATPADLLLLDEPTNHLDLDAVLWLESWLRGCAGTLLLISHDREFLDPIVDHVALVSAGRIALYTGNYSEFERHRAVEVERSRRSAERRRRERARMQAFVDRFRYKASRARQAQSRLKALERMQATAPVPVERRFAFGFLEPAHSPRPVAKLDAASFGYDGRTVLREVTMTLAPGDRVALLGANGAGKSTLMRALAGRIASDAGTVDARLARVGYFAQHRLEQLDPRRTPLELARAAAPEMREQEIRDFLGGFGFGDAPATVRVAPLSGGEKTRLALALLVLERPNLLLLDEPTNHLDLDMRQALAVALQSFSGALVLVSHDRHLLRLASDSLWLVADARAAPFEGDLDDYRRWLSERPPAARVPGTAPPGGAMLNGGGASSASTALPGGTPPPGNAASPGGTPPSGGTVSSPGPRCPPATRRPPPARRRPRPGASGGASRRRSGAGPPLCGASWKPWSAGSPRSATSGRRSSPPWPTLRSTTTPSAPGSRPCSCGAERSKRRSRTPNPSGSRRASSSTRSPSPARRLRWSSPSARRRGGCEDGAGRTCHGGMFLRGVDGRNAGVSARRGPEVPPAWNDPLASGSTA